MADGGEEPDPIHGAVLGLIAGISTLTATLVHAKAISADQLIAALDASLHSLGTSRLNTDQFRQVLETMRVAAIEGQRAVENSQRDANEVGSGHG